MAFIARNGGKYKFSWKPSGWTTEIHLPPALPIRGENLTLTRAIRVVFNWHFTRVFVCAAETGRNFNAPRFTHSPGWWHSGFLRLAVEPNESSFRPIMAWSVCICAVVTAAAVAFSYRCFGSNKFAGNNCERLYRNQWAIIVMITFSVVSTVVSRLVTTETIRFKYTFAWYVT